MIVLTATVAKEIPEAFLTNVAGNGGFFVWHNDPNIGVVAAYHEMWKRYRQEDIQVYMHDDLTIHEPQWEGAIRAAFEDPRVAIVGLGGALGMGTNEIYKVPYRFEQLMRLDYGSNSTDWLTHGTRELKPRQVAVVDGYFMAVRGEFLRETQGWSWIQSNFHCYDTAMCLEAHRRGWKVVAVPVSCTHQGGGTSTKAEYAEWCIEHGTTLEEQHSLPHVWLYERYRDVLPLRVRHG